MYFSNLIRISVSSSQSARLHSMTKAIPQIQKYMTTQPHSIGSDQKIVQAEKMMREHSFRHLPVLDGSKVVGLLSDRDIKLVEILKDADPNKLCVSDVMREDVFSVSPNALLNDVCLEMAEKKYGSAVVVDNQKLVGIFTEVDAMRALSELLTGRLG